jgi:hypothetical protein
MKAFTLAIVCVVAGTARLAAAGNLINKDTKSYDVDVTCDGATTHTTLAPNATQEDGVSKACIVKIKGGATHTVKDDSNVTIKGGKLSESPSTTKN